MHIFVAGAVTIIIGGLFWMIFTMGPSAIIDVEGRDSYAEDAQTTIDFMEASITATPIVIGIVIIAWGVTRSIEERETGTATL